MRRKKKKKLVKAISFSVERSFPVTRGMEELRFSWYKAAGIGSIRQKPPKPCRPRAGGLSHCPAMSDPVVRVAMIINPARRSQRNDR